MKISVQSLVKCALVAGMAFGLALQASAQTVSPAKRLTQPIDEKNMVTLSGRVNPRAQSKYDQGAAPDAMPMARMKLLLKRSPEQEKALKQVIEAQQAKGSATYHQWLTPAQIGAQFGVSDDDVKTVSSWLESHGFQVSNVSKSRMTIEFSGTAGAVRNAFHTEMHTYVVNGEAHVANVSDPQIPAALASVVDGPVSLNNFKRKPLLRKVGIFSKDRATGKVTPKDTIANCSAGPGNTCFAVSPGDFAKIYNVPATVGGNPAGASQTIAIVGDSEICTASSPDFSQCPQESGSPIDDVKQFRTLFGLPTGAAANLPQVIVAGNDPLFNGDETEGDLDVEWAGAVAPNAQILFVIGQDTDASAGIDLAAEYIIDNNLAPVMSESFGSCEAFLGTGGIQFFNALWEQAAAQGITVIVSSGDAGAAACDNPDQVSIAADGLNVNGIASTPYNIAAGGTDFNINATGYPNQFWNTSGVVSAKGYVPETTWNDTCAQAAASATCASLSATSSNSLVSVVGGGGGQSAVIAKPSWQTGTGVPNDSARDLPDISLFSADGDVSGSFYIVCEADAVTNTATGCDTANPLPFNDFIGVGGTSAAAPTFAAIMSLVNQKTGARQGNANYILYPLQSTAGVFNDITVGNNSVPCAAGSVANCSSTASVLGFLQTLNGSSLPSGTAAYSAGTGYDLATGLGSVNVGNLLAAWPTSGSFTPTATTLSITPSTITHGATVTVKSSVTPGPAASTASSNNPEAVSLIGTCPVGTPHCFGSSLSNTAGVDHFDPQAGNVDAYPIVTTAGVGNANGTTGELVGGTYTVLAHYPGDGTLGASDSAPVTVTVNSEASTTSIVVGQLDFNTNQVFSVSTAPYGSELFLRTDVIGTASQLETGTGVITIKDNGGALAAGAYPLNPDGYMEVQSPGISTPGKLNSTVVIPALAVGTHALTVTYPGDASYKASNGNIALVVTKAPTASAITSAPTSVASGGNFNVTVLVDTPTVNGGSSGNAPTGTVTFFNGTTQIGSPVNVTAAQDSAGFSAATATISTSITATGTISAMYNGDANYTASAKSSPVTITTTAGSGDFSVSGATPVTISAPGQSGSSVVTVSAGAGFSGTVTLGCSVSPATLTDPPGCGFSAASVAIANPASGTSLVSATSTLMLTTTAASRLVPVAAPSSKPSLRVPAIGVATVFALALLLFFVPANRRRGAAVLGVAAFAVMITAAGCGGGGGGGGTHNPGTATGAYVVTVTATSGSTTHSTQVTFNLQ